MKECVCCSTECRQSEMVTVTLETLREIYLCVSCAGNRLSASLEPLDVEEAAKFLRDE